MTKEKIKFHTLDIENKGLGRRFVLAGVYDGRRYYEFEKEDDCMRFILNIEGCVFVHSLAPNIKQIVSWCEKNKIEIKSSPVMLPDMKIIEWKIGNTIFRDGFSLTRENLQKLAESFGLKNKLVGLRDYKKLKKSPELRKYLKADVVVLHQILTRYFRFVGIQNFKKKTIASISLEMFKKSSPESYNRIVQFPIFKKDEKFLRKSYFCGYFAIFEEKIESTEKMRFLKLDINGFFGMMMKNNSFPWGQIIRTRNKDEISELLKSKLGIIKAKTKIPKGLRLGFLPIKVEGSEVEYPIKGTIRGVWTTSEIIYAQKLGYKFSFEKAIFWQFQDYLFRKHIKQLSKIKDNSRGAKKVIAKALMVSLYGKFGQRRDVLMFKQTDVPIAGKLYLDKEMTMTQEKRYIRTPYSHVEISIFTTSYSRIFIHQFCQEVGWDRVLCIADDSLILRDDFSDKFKKQWFHQTEMGKFRVVSQIKEGMIFGKGIYALKDINGVEIIKNQDRIKNYDYFRGFKKVEEKVEE